MIKISDEAWMARVGEGEAAAPNAGLSVDPEHLSEEIVAKLAYAIGKHPLAARGHDWLSAAILAIRDRVIDRWLDSLRETYASEGKRVYYLSLEFLIGRLLRDAVSNLGMMAALKAALERLGVELDVIAELEPDAALGNGGLGRLAACFMESMATLNIPAYGYGIRYEHGLFRQKIIEGWQVELPETWLTHGNPWEFERQERSFEIGFGGTVETIHSSEGAPRQAWTPAETVLAVAYDTPIVGWRAERVNTLRLWSARAVDPIRLDAFNRGDHVGAQSDRARAESITRVLYPADSTEAGQELRLKQEYFFTAASLYDIARRHMQQYGEIGNLAEKAAVQLNDTHPAIAVAELMRLLTDSHGLEWNEAWKITRETIAYTNHTLLPEALESWPVPLFERLLPRHMQIIYAINARLVADARNEKPGDDGFLSAVSLIDEGAGRRVRMGHLAFAGSHKVNGVSALHTKLMKETVFRDLSSLYPGRIVNKTNGITPRRWLHQVNPALVALIREAIGGRFLDDTQALIDLDRHAEDAAFRARFQAVKRANKERLSNLIALKLGIKTDPDALFDVHIKRIHEYKRQHLNILETIALYNAIRADPAKAWVPRVKVFAGKAAASYVQAKTIIKLINDVGAIVNSDPAIGDLLKVVFLPNYNVSLAETIIPAADLSEQISTAGMEASGTGNMKLALNGALTIGTLDGANIELRERVGKDNIMIFGLTAQGVEDERRQNHDPARLIADSPRLKEVLAALTAGVFSPDDAGRYKALVEGLVCHDWFMVTADFDAYARAQRDIDAWRGDPDQWTAKAVRNTARVGWFSSDRTIREYAQGIWDVPAR